jgi:acyl-CoA dehydrogenase
VFFFFALLTPLPFVFPSWAIPPQTEVLKAKAKAAGLWNLWLPKDTNHGAGGGGLTNLEYAPLCEIMGSSMLAPEIFNCNGPTAIPFFHF